MLQRIVKNRWFLRLTAFFSIALLVWLGFWQIHRGELKASLQQAQRLAAAKEPSWLKPKNKPAPYQRIIVQGSYDPRLIFLDNQHWQHRDGYHVLSPFVTETGSIILVNRGWVPGDQSRQTLPNIRIPEGKQRITGQVWYPSLRSWSIGPQVEIKNAHAAVIEQANPVLIERFLGQTPTPYILRLDNANPDGFIRVWPEQTLSVQRHYAYAFQWFAMAFTVAIITIVLSRRRGHETA